MEVAMVRHPLLFAVFFLAIAGSSAIGDEVEPLTQAQERRLKPREIFKECEHCPEMVVVPAGELLMGSPRSEPERGPGEGPQRVIAFAKPFAVGRFGVTVGEWEACLAGGGWAGCAGSAEGFGRGGG